jgi:hypothetical protein
MTSYPTRLPTRLVALACAIAFLSCGLSAASAVAHPVGTAGKRRCVARHGVEPRCLARHGGQLYRSIDALTRSRVATFAMAASWRPK